MSHLPRALALALVALTPAPARGQTDPREVIRAAVRAVEGDSVTRAADRWRERLRRDSADRAATLGLATLAALTYDYASADRLYARAHAVDSVAPDRWTVYARLGHAQSWEQRAGVPQRQLHFTRALLAARAVRDPVAEAQALLGLSFVRAVVQGMASAHATLDSANALLPPTEYELHVDRLRRLTMVLPELGRPGATAAARASMEMARRAGTPRAEAHALRTVGYDHYMGGRVDSALVYFRRAEERYARARDWYDLARTAAERANAVTERADPREIADASAAVLSAGRRAGWRSAEFVGNNGLGLAMRMLGDLPASRVHLTRALAAGQQLGDSMAIYATRALLASTELAAGELAAAKGLILPARDRYRATGEHDSYYQLQSQLVSIALRERDLREAERLLGEMRSMQRRYTLAPRDLLFQEGRVAAELGRLDVAERALRRYLATLDSTQHVARWGVQLRLADVAARRGETARAAAQLLAASEAIDRWRAVLSDSAMRRLVFQTSRFDQQEDDVLLARAIALIARGGQPAIAFELAERRRARDLADRMTRAATLRSDVAARESVAEPWAAARPHDAARVQAALPDDATALLEYVAGGHAPTTLFVLTRSAVRVYVLPPVDSIAQTVARLGPLLEGGSDASAIRRALGAALLDSAVAALPAAVHRLVIVPDAVLHRVPFDALLLGDGRAAVHRFTVALAPSATVSAMLWRSTRPAPNESRVLAFGDPAFASLAPTEPSATTYRSAADSTLPRLAHSGREARLVARYGVRSVVRLGREATAAYLRRAPLDSFRVVHFATHALVDDRTMARTALALAPGEGESGFVTPGDLAALRMNTDLVVLSACRTAGGVIVGGEGVQGLTAPLLQAGARSVVATSWRIGDRRAVPLVRAFYDALAARRPVGDALRAAKLAAIRRGAPPGEWAAFQVIGDPLVRVPLRRPAPEPTWWNVGALVALAAAGGAYALYARRRSRRATPAA